jgi:16S rRNA (guanine527-N7)-methyltransferase
LDVSRETPLSKDELIGLYFPNRELEIEKYAQFLIGAGIERGLIGPREGDRIWERHIFNCLPVSTLVPEGSLLFDIGSGAGLPGIVISLARPDLKITLIEPLSRRVEFLEEAITLLSIENVSVIRGKSENVKKSANYVTARAVAPLEKLKKITSHMIKPGGALLAMKGESATEEAKTVPNAKVIEVKLHGLEMARIIKVDK